MSLSFCLDATSCALINPLFTLSNPDWAFFRDESPWIRLSYLVLIFSIIAAQRFTEGLSIPDGQRFAVFIAVHLLVSRSGIVATYATALDCLMCS